MRVRYVMLIPVLLASFTAPAWADPGRDESGNGRYESHVHYVDYREAQREAAKHHWERRREAAKARREYEREEAKAWAEIEREERKHYEEMQREAYKHREEMRRESLKPHDEMRRDSYFQIEATVYIP